MSRQPASRRRLALTPALPRRMAPHAPAKWCESEDSCGASECYSTSDDLKAHAYGQAYRFKGHAAVYGLRHTEQHEHAGNAHGPLYEYLEHELPRIKEEDAQKVVRSRRVALCGAVIAWCRPPPVAWRCAVP